MLGERCLVVGGAGSLGGHIVQLLLDKGAEVSVVDIVPSLSDAVASTVLDISKEVGALVSAMEGISIVFHAASIIDIRPVPSESMERVNVQGTRNVIDACKAADVRQLIYTSSVEVVGGYDVDGTLSYTDGADEDTPAPARHFLPYGASKAAAEALVLDAHCAELSTCSLRPGYIVGPGCIGLKIEIAKAVQRSNYYVTAQVPAQISCVHVRNCAIAHVLAAGRPSAVAGKPFFVRDFEANVVDIALAAVKTTPIKPVLLPLWAAYGMAWVLDRFERGMHALYALVGATRQTGQDVVDINAVRMAWHDICVSGERAKKCLGYGAPDGPTLTSKEDCFAETAAWAADFYLQLAGNQDKL